MNSYTETASTLTTWTAEANGSIPLSSPFAANISDQDILDLTAYYSYLPRLPGGDPVAAVAAPLIVVVGAPMRDIAPCGSRHGGSDTKAGSPWLGGQSAIYITAQLQAFVAGTRRNDISQQMRNIAHLMTGEEIEEATRYYASLR
jgi:cytochrome c553